MKIDVKQRLIEYPYQFKHFSKISLEVLKVIPPIRKTGYGEHKTITNVIFAIDTETSKSDKRQDNHLCAWTLSARAWGQNLFTAYGTRPSELIHFLTEILEVVKGETSIFYIHNLAYDYTFLRKFLFREYGYPERELNTKPHYPINIEFKCGLILRDSLILAQRKLEKWSEDLNVEHKKAVGFWDYDILRNQDYVFNADELTYIENDTLALVECIDATMQGANKNIASLPLTATGIPRNQLRESAKKNQGHRWFLKSTFSYEQQKIAEQVYHGGYTHANRHYIGDIIDCEDFGKIECYDFASSYPFCLFKKFPCEKFTLLSNDFSMWEILENKETCAFMFKLILIDCEVKSDTVMPVLQYYKCEKTINAVIDNGRILKADYIEIWLTEIDLGLIEKQYKFKNHICTEVYASEKDYLPRWFTDFVFKLFENKTKLKGGDPVLYAISKALLNALYGLTVQKPIPDDIKEEYVTGEYYKAEQDEKELYEKFLKKRTSILPYHIGVWVTAYAMENLFRLGDMCNVWLYSDTDSCYGCGWDKKKVEEYNTECINFMTSRGYGGVEHNGQTYNLGVAEEDGTYNKFVTNGAKRYCCEKPDGSLKLTVAGVPKKGGAECLQGDINKFKKGFIFSGEITGKLTHTYIYVDDIYLDEYGNEVGDSIDLTPCDYLLDKTDIIYDWDKLMQDEIIVQVLEDKNGMVE